MNNGYVIFVIGYDMKTGYFHSAGNGNLVVTPSPCDAFKFPSNAAAEHFAERLSEEDMITYYEIHELSDVNPSASSLGGFGINT